MTFKHTISIALLLVLMNTFLPANAQNMAIPIAYGDEVQGTLTAETFEVAYNFTGSAGDVVVMEMFRTDLDSDVDRPALALFNSDRTPLVQTDGFGSVQLAAQLPSDGTYTVIATRDGGREGDSVGAFGLRLIQPEAIVDKQTIEGVVTNEAMTYYVFETAESLNLSYRKISGSFFPQMTVNVITPEGGLDEVAVVSGNRLVNGIVGIESAGTTTNTYIVVMEKSLFDFNFDPIFANYTLSLLLGE